jgi:hypothetical protein
MTLRRVAMLAVLAALLASAQVVLAQGKKSDSVVKAKAAADKPTEGKQVITVTLEIDPKYHIYANPVGLSDLESTQTVLKVAGKAKLDSVKVEYPPGKLVKDQVVGDYKIYEGKVKIKATVQRSKNDTGALEVSIKLQACSKTGCLLPATIKVPVP